MNTVELPSSEMAIADIGIKLLWGRAGNCCSFPGCEFDLTPRLAKRGDVVLGEMAHIVGQKPSAARSNKTVGIDDSYSNLILLCPNHHALVDKSPTDYPVRLLRKWKADWEAKVKAKLTKRASVDGSSGKVEMRVWAYFNFSKILSLYHATQADKPLPSGVSKLQIDGVVDDGGFPIGGPSPPGERRTVFETWPQDKAHRLERFYSGMVEQIVSDNSLLDLEEMWGVTKLRGLLYPGAVVFLNRGLRFKRIKKKGECEERIAYCRAKRVELRFQIDTWNVCGSSAVESHFAGNSTVASLLLVRSVVPASDTKTTKLAIKATPIALGTGFWPSKDKTPAIAE
jgi:hypothetical protein